MIQDIYLGVDSVGFTTWVPNICWSFKHLKSRKKELPRPSGLLLIDSNGFGEIKAYGRYTFTIDEYLKGVRRFKPDYFVTMDWMCEPDQIQKTGLSVKDHIEQTVDNYRVIRERLNPDEIDRCIPVIQGWSINDYLDCIDLYHDYGLITDYMGIGSICRRGQTKTIATIINIIHDEIPRTRLHGFGIKKSVLNLVSSQLYSMDTSSIWFYEYVPKLADKKIKYHQCLEALETQVEQQKKQTRLLVLD